VNGFCKFPLANVLFARRKSWCSARAWDPSSPSRRTSSRASSRGSTCSPSSRRKGARARRRDRPAGGGAGAAAHRRLCAVRRRLVRRGRARLHRRQLRRLLLPVGLRQRRGPRPAHRTAAPGPVRQHVTGTRAQESRVHSREPGARVSQRDTGHTPRIEHAGHRAGGGSWFLCWWRLRMKL